MKGSCTSHYKRLNESSVDFSDILDDFKDLSIKSLNKKQIERKQESLRSRVAMDFTSNVGRIVNNRKEAKEISLAESYLWKRHPQFDPRISTINESTGNTQRVILESNIHTTQPWFHVGISRGHAGVLVQRYGAFDGVFLVRDSRSNPKGFVITYKYRGNVFNTQIATVSDPMRDTGVYSLDAGVTRFYDLLQLIEFYHLNAGSLPTRLTHYVVKSDNCVSYK